MKTNRKEETQEEEEGEREGGMIIVSLARLCATHLTHRSPTSTSKGSYRSLPELTCERSTHTDVGLDSNDES